VEPILIAAPIILFEDDTSVSMFPTIEDAEGYIEAPDAAALIAFDAKGRALEIEVIGKDALGTGGLPIRPIRLRPVEDEPTDRHALAQLLTARLGLVGDDASLPLPELVRRAWAVWGSVRTKLGGWRFGPGQPYPGDQPEGDAQ
jgi:hypothetical protein